MSVLSQPHFHDEAKAFAFLESIVWADGVVCPHCGVVDGRVYDLAGVRGKPSKKSPEGAIRYGLKKCGACRKQFTVKVGTVFEHARMPLHKMLQAVHLIMSSKKGISSHQLSRVLEIQYNTAWFLSHRIREAMRTGELTPFGGEGGVVEVDETFIGIKDGYTKQRHAFHHKVAVLSLVHRETGQSRSFVVDGVSRETIIPLVMKNVQRETYIMTDEARVYYGQFRNVFLGHGRVNHQQGEYGRGRVFTNTVEGFFSIFKRGMKGVYQHCREKHLHRYIAEFDFRYCNREANGFNDGERSREALKAIVGKRLTYRRPHEQVIS
jgi:transposase-like protein